MMQNNPTYGNRPFPVRYQKGEKGCVPGRCDFQSPLLYPGKKKGVSRPSGPAISLSQLQYPCSM